MKRKAKVKYFTQETEEQPISKKEFLRMQKEQAIDDCISQIAILRKQIFTESQIKQLISKKILSPVIYKTKIFYKTDEVRKGVKYLSHPPKLFPL